MKKFNIVFSIPVHEKYEVVIDLILNVFGFNPECAIVLHYANGFREAKSAISFDEFESAIKKIGNVYVNPETVRTGMYDIIQAHVSNFRYIESQIDFEYFALTASNELFIKEGLFNHIKNYDAGVSFIDIDSEKKWIIAGLAKQDKVLIDYLSSKGWNKIMGSHVEGSFYRKELMSEIVEHIESFFDYKIKGVFYPRDEVFFPTFLWNIAQEKELNILNPGLYCWTPWNKSCFQWDIRVKDVKRLLKFCPNIFSVKRIPRVIDNHTRIYIRRFGNYMTDENEFIPLPNDTFSDIDLWKKDMLQSFKSSYTSKVRTIKNFLLRLYPVKIIYQNRKNNNNNNQSI